MTLRHIWWFILAIQLVSVACFVVELRRYRRGGIPLPETFVAIAVSSCGGLLLIASRLLVGVNQALSWLVLATGMVLIGDSLLRFRRTRVRKL